MAVGEVWILDPRRMVEYYGASDELHLAFNFAFLRAPWSAEAFRQEVELFESILPPGAWPDYTLSNHDNPRAVSRYAHGGDLIRGRRRARLAALMLLTLRGTPFIYQGEEIGMADGPVPSERFVDVAGRDPERTPMQWDGSATGGFTTGDPWLPVNPETAAVNVAVQRDDPVSMLNLYQQLIRIRRGSPALRRGTYRTTPDVPPDVFAYTRGLDRERWAIVLNFGDAERSVGLDSVSPGTADTRLRLSTNPGRQVGVSVGSVVAVGPEEGVLIDVGGGLP